MDIYDFSEDYRMQLEDELCKKDGVYYTPEFLVKFIAKRALEGFELEKDTSILDLASGYGLFYYELLECLKEKEEIRKEKEIKKNNIKNKKEKVAELISDHLFSVEKDIDAVNGFKKFLKERYSLEENFKNNILCDDALFPQNNDFLEKKFDLIVGNPPYVGHKMIDSDYGKRLRLEYPEVYLKKADLYYCFFKFAIEKLKDGGLASLIVPRYFLEAHSAASVRDYLLENAEITALYDFRVTKAFSQEINICPCIISFRKYSEEEKEANKDKDISEILNPEIFIVNDIERFTDLAKKNKVKSNGSLDADGFSWSTISFEEKRIIDAIRKKKCFRLGELVENYQGIITGCDKAFILDANSPFIDDIDPEFLKPWIKSKNIGKFLINEGIEEKKLVYTNNALESDFRGDYRNHLISFKEKLEKRREVTRGLRRWYDLQWGRREEIFEQEKIVYPFKSKENRFSLDFNNSYFSADVYCFSLKKNSEISYVYLLCLLNSWVYEKYMQSFLKKMGNSIYEYYPYMLLQTFIYVDENYNLIEKLGKEILAEENKVKRGLLLNKINEIILHSLKITKF